MFVLIKWIDSNEVTVMEETPDLEKSNEGDTVNVLYGDEYYEGTLIKRSGRLINFLK